MTREERIIAHVDGELGPTDAAAFEAEIAADSALAAEVARHRALAQRVGAAFAPVLEEPVPPQLLAVAAVANDPRPSTVRRVAPWGAAAAALVLGVIAGRMSLSDPTGLAVGQTGMVAKRDLARALSNQLSSEPGLVNVGLTVKTTDGRYCRTFRSRPDRLAGLACREDGHWAVRTVTAWIPEVEPAYRTAGSDTPPEVLAAVDDLAGQPLDSAAERAARDSGWR